MTLRSKPTNLKKLRKLLDAHPLKPDVFWTDAETARELGYEVFTVVEARALLSTLDAHTVPELKRLAKLYFKVEWTSAANKKTIIKGFTKHLEKYIKNNV